MVSYDDQTVIRLISELKNAVGRLKTLSRLHPQSFLEDPDKVGSAKYHFIVAIESCIDLCNHFIARNRFRAPEDYSDTFTVMAENGVIDATFATEMRKTAIDLRGFQKNWKPRRSDDRLVHVCLGGG